MSVFTEPIKWEDRDELIDFLLTSSSVTYQGYAVILDELKKEEEEDVIKKEKFRNVYERPNYRQSV